jgi:hypothetical protein
VSDIERISVTRRIPAPANDIYVLVTDPAMHVEIDGSGMLQLAPDAKPLENVGDTFLMDMDREPLGDIPLGKYQVLNTVTRITPDAEVEWSIGGVGMDPLGHVYGFVLEAVDDGETEVIHYCDWSGVPAEMRSVLTFPVVPVHMLEQTLENLDSLATRRDP